MLLLTIMRDCRFAARRMVLADNVETRRRFTLTPCKKPHVRREHAYTRHHRLALPLPGRHQPYRVGGGEPGAVEFDHQLAGSTAAIRAHSVFQGSFTTASG
jgi:hypothetical protein